MEPPASTPDVTAARLTVVVERSGGLAGMVRRWTAEIPDDGSPAGRAARRIAGLISVDPPPGNWRSKVAQNVPDSAENRATSDRQMREGRSAVRDGFQWSVRCEEGSLHCDEAGRRRDPEVDAMIRAVTEVQEADPAGP